MTFKEKEAGGGILEIEDAKKPYTVTRPYAGFRHPDRMAPDQTVRGGENDYGPGIFSLTFRSFP
jgi:hypothetical protein